MDLACGFTGCLAAPGLITEPISVRVLPAPVLVAQLELRLLLTTLLMVLAWYHACAWVAINLAACSLCLWPCLAPLAAQWLPGLPVTTLLFLASLYIYIYTLTDFTPRAGGDGRTPLVYSPWLEFPGFSLSTCLARGSISCRIRDAVLAGC